MSTARLRLATRAIVVDEVERVLLVRFDFGDRIVWATPGGGIEEGESDDVALDQRSIALGDGQYLDIYPTPGHTACSISLRLGGLLMIGDVPFAARAVRSGRLES